MTELPTDWDERLWSAAIDLSRLARDRMGEAGDLITPADLRRLGLAATPAEAPDAQRLVLAAIAEMRRLYVGTPPNVDEQDAFTASILSEVEDRIRAALASPPDAAGTVER
jgi:hypothetical protein